MIVTWPYSLAAAAAAAASFDASSFYTIINCASPHQPLYPYACNTAPSPMYYYANLGLHCAAAAAAANSSSLGDGGRLPVFGRSTIVQPEAPINRRFDNLAPGIVLRHCWDDDGVLASSSSSSDGDDVIGVKSPSMASCDYDVSTTRRVPKLFQPYKMTDDRIGNRYADNV